MPITLSSAACSSAGVPIFRCTTDRPYQALASALLDSIARVKQSRAVGKSPRHRASNPAEMLAFTAIAEVFTGSSLTGSAWRRQVPREIIRLMMRRLATSIFAGALFILLLGRAAGIAALEGHFEVVTFDQYTPLAGNRIDRKSTV